MTDQEIEKGSVKELKKFFNHPLTTLKDKTQLWFMINSLNEFYKIMEKKEDKL